MKVLSVFGTRPEAIKMGPLVKALGEAPDIESIVCTTGQHRAMLDQVMSLFAITADHDLDVMVPNQTLNGLCAKLFERLDALYTQVRPDRVLVHGDTTTAMTAAVAAFHHRIPIGHVEAGLRTGDIHRPWPEEMNRRVIDVVADHLFAPTPSSRSNLAREHLGGNIVVTGNTVIDALQQTVQQLDRDPALRARADAPFQMLDPKRRLLLVTGHRRESFGQGFLDICRALAELARREDLQVLYPVHLNPNVQGPVNAELGHLHNVHLVPPQDYLSFVRLMQRADVILTDSGGVQEEAPALAKPVLVMRDVTERPEAVEAGVVKLVGTLPARIVESVNAALAQPAHATRFDPDASPYGDGRASARIVAALRGQPLPEFNPGHRSAGLAPSPLHEVTP
ncbi:MULTISPECIES: non-hydrolyzing UDP-N-acetylglucosamine 2-epimerase [Stenotrophomonas]|uniref:non-hydrolyzing UDP-N-acetylglucosamine 2-epimerase n=1 Tax=Stenotrophomonas TaxID=40323 RepID=UPI0005B79C96|nr:MULTISPECIES: UDP-N-acetylglucosamine 2-epimerase (non-hydrolyzing) [Stenotrophomonas]EKT4097560.1 UDP-N-acetylglucosamine 2-epimerase (non-hydrolyzing) [Stenotrophomonas maltophilia]KUO99433.1 UDP-N-acetyl glucosamine 2-epimerase [Stenotrophomonas maltophilia]MCF3459314.1 UDP-N-acetylglucosamine 2-epimerase (non-hydrolyzing) [Stenotrophomonas maltophilia]MCF3516233.1 UDP-N-acetylglucosamine 2-epimerase (non-hydrolyzing) [Stenotrophomonas maltophilia]UXB20733.1 UDP-N-acetylglucosamine 2-epi